MHDPKFEKEVQQKMKELEFSPSESVWANVEKEINQLHTRRSFPFFWRLALPALLLLAGGGYYFFRSKPATVSAANPVAATSTHSVPAAPATSNGATSETAASNAATSTGTASNTAKAPGGAAVSPAPSASLAYAPTTSGSSPAAAPSATSASSTPTSAPSTSAAPAPAATASAPASVTSGLTARPSISPKPGTDRSTTLAAATHNISTTTSSRNTPATGSNPHRVNRTKGHPAVRSTTEGQSDDLIAAAPGTANAAPGNSTTEPATQDGLVTSATATPGNSTVAANHTITSGAGRQPFQFNPAIANLNSSAAPIQARKLATKSAVAIKTLQSPHRPWEAAFAGGIGVSSLHQVQISNVTLNNAVNSYSNATTSNTVTYNAARPSKQYVSTVKPGVSFWAGVLAHKPLSDRWGLSLGLNLSYYSTRVRIGEQVNNYTPSTSTLLTSSAVAPIQSYPYYNTGNDQAYTNRYYFLELPVAAEWRINRSHLLPLFWDGGLSLSYLMGSSAVYYNTKSGVYFKDGGVANHTQINISTALMVGLPIRGLRVQLGPQVQYGLTPLLNTELSGQQHIFYGGLRLVVYPGKK